MERSNRKGVLIGSLLIIIGLIFLLDNLGFAIDMPWYIFRWPMILILIGIFNLVSGNIRPAFILLGLGGLFYLDIFNLIDIGELWPVILIIIGLAFLFRRGRIIKPVESEEDYIDEVAIFGGTDKSLVSESFQGGKITCLFGGSKLDLRGSKIEDTTSIELFCMFGGAEITVPGDWKLNTNATAVLGGFSDERKSISENPKGTLNIKGFVMFGGCEIKN